MTLCQGVLMNQREGRGESDETKSWKRRGATRGNPTDRMEQILESFDLETAAVPHDLRDRFFQQIRLPSIHRETNDPF